MIELTREPIPHGVPGIHALTRHTCAFGSYAARALMTTLVFVLIYPLLATLAFVALVARSPLFEETTGPGLVGFWLIVLLVSIAGILSAALIGLAVAGAARDRSSAPTLYVVSAAVGGFSPCSLVALFLPQWEILAGVLTAGALAALLCTWLTRGLGLAHPPKNGMTTDTKA